MKKTLLLAAAAAATLAGVTPAADELCTAGYYKMRVTRSPIIDRPRIPTVTNAGDTKTYVLHAPDVDQVDPATAKSLTARSCHTGREETIVIAQILEAKYYEGAYQ